MSQTEQTRPLTRASRETLLHMLETLSDAFFVVDDAQTIVYANASAQALTQATPEQVVGTSLWRGAPQLVSIALYQAVQQAKQTRAPTDVEYLSPVTRTWLRVQLSPTDGGLTLQFHQVSAPAHRQERSSGGEFFPLALLDGLCAGICLLTPEGVVLEISEIPLDDAQIRREEVIGQPLAQTPWWSFAPAAQEQLRTAIAHASTGQTVRFETRLRPREGMCVDLEATITPQMNAHNHIEYLVYVGIDITARKRAEGQRKASEEHWHVLAEMVPQMVWTSRPDGQHEYTNQRWHDYTGLTLEHMQSDRWAPLQCIHPDDRESSRAHWQHALDTGAMYEHEERFRNSQTGEYRWFFTRGMPMRDDAGQIIKWFGTSTDIEEQKRTEQALRQSQERASVLMNSSIIGIFVREGEQIVDANDTFLRMTDYSREDLRAGSMNWVHMTPPEYLALAQPQQAQQELATGQSIGPYEIGPYEKEYICQDGSRFPALVCAVTLEHHPLHAITFVLDNSARKELEQRKDAFIGMASHELRTPLTVLNLQTQLLAKQLARQGMQDAVPSLSRMEAQINTITRLVKELLDVSKIQAGRLEYVRERVDLDVLLREITDTMQHTHPSHRILVHGLVQASLLGDPDRLGQVFTNLLSNAIKYSPEAQAVEMDLCADPQTVTIRVRDHGLGIAPEQREKIFERFYRASVPKQRAIPGLGMGLYIVAEILKRHGGTISVDSEVGRGSTFTVTLPLSRDT